MVPLKRLTLEHEQDDRGEDRQGDDLLDHLELQQVERSPVAGETDAVGRDGQAVLEKSDPPGEKDDQDQRPSGRDLHLLQLEMAVPGERHENVRTNEHEDGPETLHDIFLFWAANLINLYDK